MIYGVGVDSVEVARMVKSMQRPHFMQRVFSAEERALLSGGGPKLQQSAAACFAAKEAFLKAAGVGLGGFALGDIAALRKEGGAPYYQFAGEVARFMEREGLAAHLSLTHEAGLAIAFAVLEK